MGAAWAEAWDGRGHADIDDHDARAHFACDDVDGGAARQEVRHHLGGDSLWPGCNAFVEHTVVAGEDSYDRRGGNRRWARARNARQLLAEGLEATKSAGGLCQPVLTLPGGERCSVV
jgi:hypothetical protein